FFKKRLTELETQSPRVASVLKLVFELFCLTVMDQSYDRGGGFGDFVAAGVLPHNGQGQLLRRIKQLLKDIRPHAVPLVDGWNIPDFLLNSVLGRYDGRVYESLYESTRNEPLNETDISEGYYKHLQYLLHPERRRDEAAAARAAPAPSATPPGRL
ncbi:unnamed protein product, partial [Polarella glacialis]